MRTELRDLMDVMIKGILMDDACADELAKIAWCAAQDGQQEVAGGLLRVSRQHRVKALELQGRLAALSKEYAEFLHEGE